MSPSDILIIIISGASIAPALVLSIIALVKTADEDTRNTRKENGNATRLRRYVFCLLSAVSAGVLGLILTILAVQPELETTSGWLIVGFSTMVYGILAYTAHLLVEIPPLRDRIREAVLAEREACAKLVDRCKREAIIPGQRNDQVYREQAYRTISEELAGKIRARE